MITMDPTHFFYFVVYQVFPYVVITVWLIGSFIRFLTHPYTVKSQSSEFLGSKKEINWGARFFHVGVIGLLFGHLLGLFVPKQFLLDFGITPQMTQQIEIVAGGACAILCLVGVGLMIHRQHQKPSYSQDFTSKRLARISDTCCCTDYGRHKHCQLSALRSFR